MQLSGPAAPSTSEESDFSFLHSPDVGRVEEVTAEQETSRTGRKRVRNPDKWAKKHVKRPGLRKNSPRLQIADLSDCCRKKCLQQLSPSHLNKIRDIFESMYYEEQNIYLNGILKRREAKKKTWPPKKGLPYSQYKGKKSWKDTSRRKLFYI